MSRIYEALQKAESERKLERREPELRVPDQTAAATRGGAAAVAQSDETLLTSRGFAEEPVVSQPYSDLSAQIAGYEPLDLSAVPQHRWALSLPQLPALLERGPAVEQFRSLRSRIF